MIDRKYTCRVPSNTIPILHFLLYPPPLLPPGVIDILPESKYNVPREGTTIRVRALQLHSGHNTTFSLCTMHECGYGLLRALMTYLIGNLIAVETFLAFTF